MNNKLAQYLAVSEAIDYDNPIVSVKAREIASLSGDTMELIKNCFEFVRDEIFHCVDYDMNPVTYRASDVLIHKTGFCYAKSHLLAALLRANSIPSGLCYQRLSFDKFDRPFCLHGLTAVYLQEYGWYRIDPRGNKKDVNAQFNPPEECLAFDNSMPGEYIFPEIWHEPIYCIKDLLTKFTDYREAHRNLPDIEVFGAGSR
ncbi:MAG TPA: transglutaminase family protein [Spirochaetota bacterium]|nr:transglutaminase family protein [Spirochaetota bacterium]HPR48483.1 transglutaminase family protein [Spirochaetota bacterium]